MYLVFIKSDFIRDAQAMTKGDISHVNCNNDDIDEQIDSLYEDCNAPMLVLQQPTKEKTKQAINTHYPSADLNAFEIFDTETCAYITAHELYKNTAEHDDSQNIFEDALSKIVSGTPNAYVKANKASVPVGTNSNLVVTIEFAISGRQFCFFDAIKIKIINKTAGLLDETQLKIKDLLKTKKAVGIYDDHKNAAWDDGCPSDEQFCMIQDAIMTYARTFE